MARRSLDYDKLQRDAIEQLSTTIKPRIVAEVWRRLSDFDFEFELSNGQTCQLRFDKGDIEEIVSRLLSSYGADYLQLLPAPALDEPLERARLTGSLSVFLESNWDDYCSAPAKGSEPSRVLVHVLKALSKNASKVKTNLITWKTIEEAGWPCGVAARSPLALACRLAAPLFGYKHPRTLMDDHRLLETRER